MSKDFLDIRIGFPADAFLYEAIGCAALYDAKERTIHFDFGGIQEDETMCMIAMTERGIEFRKFRFFDYLYKALEHEMIHDVLFQLFGPEVCQAFDSISEWFEQNYRRHVIE